MAIVRRRPVRRMTDETEQSTAPSRTPSRRPQRPADNGADEDDSLLHGGWTEGQKQMDQASPFAQALKLEDTAKIIKFMDDSPYANFRRHWIDRPGQGGQGLVRRPFTCRESIDKECPLCEVGDRAQAVSAFNVVEVGDDGQILLRTWDVGPRIFNVLKSYAKDPKIGPLSKHYFLVNKTGKQGTSQTNISSVKTSSLPEDYDIDPVDPDDLAAVKKYDASIIEMPSHKTLAEIAAEIADEYE